MPRPIAFLLSAGVHLHLLQTVYGTEDVYDMLEVLAVDAHNRRIVNKAR